MENATKSLLIIGALLITIIIVALGVKIIGSIKDTSEQASGVSKNLGSSTGFAKDIAIHEFEKITGRTDNLLTNKFSDFKLSSYGYFKLSNTSKELRITLVDKDISVDLTGISAGFTGNGSNSEDGYNWFIFKGVIQTKEYHKLNTKTWKNKDITPMMYFSFYPPTEETWNKINARWNIKVTVCSHSLGAYAYFKLGDEPKALKISLIDKNTSVDLTGITAGFTGNGSNSEDGYNWFIFKGVIQTKEYHKLNTKTWKNKDITPMMYFSYLPPTGETWDKINERWYIQIE